MTQLPYKRADASAAINGTLVWNPTTRTVQVSDAGAFQDVGVYLTDEATGGRMQVYVSNGTLAVRSV